MYQKYREDIINTLRLYDPKFNEAKINKAIDFAIHYHGSQKRASGDPYYKHPLEVAFIILSMKLDTDSVIAALLHDTVEDTELTLEDIKNNFGQEVAKLVDGVTKISKIEFKQENTRQAENFRKLLLAISQDIRVLLIKLADRLHNMRTIDYLHSHEKKMRIALETMETYAPLAERVGMQKIKTELQDISFRILHPNIRKSILSSLENLANDEENFINDIVKEIKINLKSLSINAEVYGRRKTPYSIWMKMQQKNIKLEQLSDIIAFRIIVDNVQNCYAALGVIHTKYKMIPNSFEDFISTPKNNGYQSIHTVIIGPMQQKIEIQIRTHEMHLVAEFGVAAHWKYKQKYFTQEWSKKYTWLKELLNILEAATDPDEFLKNTKLAMYYNQVFCFTPKGNVISLPKGSTVIDFAYAVHSEIGNHCIGAKINGNTVSQDVVLNNGDQVEVLVSKNQNPLIEWERFAVTGRAKSEIKKFIREKSKHQYINLGKVILEKIFKDHNITVTPLLMQKIIENCKKPNEDELYLAIADGLITKEEIIKNFNTTSVKLPRFFSFKKSSKNKNVISINGFMPGVVIHYANCCHPIPGEKIVGIFSVGKGITVHTDDCNTLLNYTLFPEDIIALSWQEDSNNSKIYRLEITILNEIGNLAVITSEFAKHKINIVTIKVVNRNEKFFQFYIDVEVDDQEKVNNIIDYFKSLKSVTNIRQLTI